MHMLFFPIDLFDIKTVLNVLIRLSGRTLGMLFIVGGH